jgi:Na+/H+ antiporter NhaD/arsenite permease-like protein
MVDVVLASVAVFLLAYLGIIFFYDWKFVVVWAGGFLLLALGVLDLDGALSSVNMNVLLLFLGMFFVSGVFVHSRMPDYLASLLVSRARSTEVVMVLVCVLSGFLSSFLDNVTVIFLVAPVALSVARRCNFSPVPLFVGMAVSANLQGCATLIGDPPSMLLAGYARLGFNDFFVLDGRPGIFFAVQLGALASLVVLYLVYRGYHREIYLPGVERYISLVPSGLVVLMVFTMAFGQELVGSVRWFNGLVALFYGFLCFLWFLGRSGFKSARGFLSRLDWRTGLFLAGLFILVEGLSASGVLDILASFISTVGHGDVFLVYVMLVGVSVFFSAFVDNIPFLVVMLPVVDSVTRSLSVSPYLFYFGMLLGASIGGNITPIGASANVVAMGIVRKEGFKTGFWDFVKIGLPFSLVSVAVSSLFVWLVFS